MKRFIVYKMLDPILRIYLRIVYNPIVIGKENIPKSGSVVLCGNHTNNLDAILLAYSNHRVVRYLTKSELHTGIKKYFFESVGSIPVHRKRKDPDAVNKAVEVLNEGGLIGIFPEGTINRTSDIIMPFKYGAVSMASKTNSLIIPFSITGKYNKFSKKRIKLTIGKPYKINDKNNLEKENERLMKKVIKLIKESDELYERQK